MKFYISILLIIGGIRLSNAQFKNYKIADNVLQPSVVINHKNPRNIIISTGTELTMSTDRGKSWSPAKVQSLHGILGRPLLISSAGGKIYFFHMTDPDGKGKKLNQLVCQSSTDDGKTWSLEAAVGNNPSKDQDRPSATIHPKKSYLCVTWTQFDQYRTADPSCQSNVILSRSHNGKKWTQPQQINQAPGDCTDNTSTAGASMPVMDSEKKMFIAWSFKDAIFLDRSYDQGKTWLTTDLPVAKHAGEWLTVIPGLDHCNRVPVLAIDNSASFFRNSLYVVWADQVNGANDTDIWFSRSVNRGDSWVAPLRVNKDSTKTHQFMPRMAVDPMTGVIYVVYYDRRSHGDLQTDVYLAYSTDGGDNFTEMKISETPFVPSSAKSFGEGPNIAADKGVIVPVWTRMDEEKTSLWTTIIQQSDIIKKQDLPRIQNVRNQKAVPRTRTTQSPMNSQFQRRRPY